MKIYRLLAAFLLLHAWLPAKAQFSLGITAGPNLSFGAINIRGELSATAFPGMKAGLAGDKMLSDSWSLQPGLYYTSYGFNYSLMRSRIDALELPVCITHKSGKPGQNREILSAGISLTLQLDETDIYPYSAYTSSPFYWPNAYRNIVVNPLASIGYEWQGGFFARATLQPGLFNPTLASYRYKWYNSQLSFTVGYFFNYAQTHSASFADDDSSRNGNTP